MEIERSEPEAPTLYGLWTLVENFIPAIFATFLFSYISEHDYFWALPSAKMFGVVMAIGVTTLLLLFGFFGGSDWAKRRVFSSYYLELDEYKNREF